MSSALSSIDPARRRQLAARLGLLAVLFLAVGGLACTRLDEAATAAFAVVALAVGVALALGGWRVARSLSTRGLPAGHAGCACGHDHDMSEMHVTGEDAPTAGVTDAVCCAGDDTGAHDCGSCAFAGRPAPAAGARVPRR